MTEAAGEMERRRGKGAIQLSVGLSGDRDDCLGKEEKMSDQDVIRKEQRRDQSKNSLHYFVIIIMSQR